MFAEPLKMIRKLKHVGLIKTCNTLFDGCFVVSSLTLYLLTWRIWWAPNNASKGQMGFNSAFKGLMYPKKQRTRLVIYTAKFTCNTTRFSTLLMILLTILAEFYAVILGYMVMSMGQKWSVHPLEWRVKTKADILKWDVACFPKWIFHISCWT